MASWNGINQLLLMGISFQPIAKFPRRDYFTFYRFSMVYESLLSEGNGLPIHWLLMKKKPAYKKPRKLKIVLLAVMGLVLITVIVVFIGYRRVVSAPELVIDSLKSGADMSIGKIHQTSTRDGRLEWSLDASSANYLQNEKAVIFKDISVIFYLKDNQKVFLTADEGTLNTASNDIVVSGNVVIQNKDYTMATEKLNYHHTERLIVAKNRINISGTAGKIAANTLKFNLNTNNVELTGDVKGFFLNHRVM